MRASFALVIFLAFGASFAPHFCFSLQIAKFAFVALEATLCAPSQPPAFYCLHLHVLHVPVPPFHPLIRNKPCQANHRGLPGAGDQVDGFLVHGSWPCHIVERSKQVSKKG